MKALERSFFLAAFRSCLLASIIFFDELRMIPAIAERAASFCVLEAIANTLAAILEFAIGIEIGQLVVVIVVLILSFISQNLFRFSKRDWVLVTSSIILGFILPLIFMSPLFS